VVESTGIRKIPQGYPALAEDPMERTPALLEQTAAPPRSAVSVTALPGNQKFIGFTDDWDADRYFTYSYSVEALQLMELDRAVWEVRRYCIPRDRRTTPKGTSIEVLDLKHIEDSDNHPPQACQSPSH
jgi:hypothetical protein